MTGAWWVPLLLVAATGLVLWSLVQIEQAGGDDRRQADDPGRAGSGDRRQAGDAGTSHGVPPARFGVTLPAYPAACPPWRPRVSAGRVTVANKIRYQYALADQPVCQVLAAYGWPAQEVTA